METLYREPLLSQITPFLCFSAADMTFTVFCIVMFFGFGFVFGLFFFIIRDVSPKNGSEVFFSHEIYEKYSLAPSLSELWHLSNRYSLLLYSFVLFVIMLLIHTRTVWGKGVCYQTCKDFFRESLAQQLARAVLVVKPQKAGRVWVGTSGLSCLLGVFGRDLGWVLGVVLVVVFSAFSDIAKKDKV